MSWLIDVLINLESSYVLMNNVSQHLNSFAFKMRPYPTLKLPSLDSICFKDVSKKN